MPTPMPEPGPDDQPPPGGLAAAGLPPGLDYRALLEALAASGALDTDPDDQDAEIAEREAAEAEGRMLACDPAALAAGVVEFMDPGPALAGWLEVAAAGAGRLDESALAGLAVAQRRAASRAQAGELAAVAQITARAAAADPKIGVKSDGRPARLGRDAIGQVQLALMLTGYGAGDWADLAVTLAWRLRATGAALAAGRIDLDRAQVIARATAVLDEQTARAVEAKVLPGAGAVTKALLQERARRVVIAADPEGAERRREAAERRACVRLYGDEDQTATLAGSGLPAVHAAAAMARITAIARAMQAAAGSRGGLDRYRAQVMLGLLLGTLPPISPAQGAPPDQPPPDQDDPDQPPPDPHPNPGHGPGPGPGPADDGGPGPAGADDGPAAAPGTGGHGGRAGDTPAADGGPWDDLPAPRDEDAPPDDGLDEGDPGGGADQSWDPAEEDDDLYGTGPAPAWPDLGAIPPALARRPARPGEDRREPDARPGRDGRPVPGLLDAVVPWATLAGLADRPGILGRIGPVTAAQARLLARAAEADPAAQWRVIVTNPAGQALAVTRISRRARCGPARDGPAAGRDRPPPGAGLVGRVTVTITSDTITAGRHRADRTRGPGLPGGPGPPAGPGPPGGPGPLPPVAAAALKAAARALDRAREQAAADQAAGGCAHAGESAAYRPPPRLREHVIARDVTCRNPACRQPAWRADLDHTIPWDQRGRTCSCNIGGACRADHQLKQHPRWKLQQTRPGEFTWTVPGGRQYIARPDIHPV